MANPKYEVNQLIYFTASADRGSLESYRVSQIRQDGRGIWMYRILVPSKSQSNAMVGDRNNLRKSYDWEMPEDEITTYCDALSRAIAYTRSSLNHLESLQSANCGGSGS